MKESSKINNNEKTISFNAEMDTISTILCHRNYKKPGIFMFLVCDQEHSDHEDKL